MRRAFESVPIRSVAVIGTGGAGLCALALARELLPKDVPTKLVGLDFSPIAVRSARDIITSDDALTNDQMMWSTVCCDAQDVESAL